MSELLEIFDEDCHPAGMAERTVAHATGLWHRAVHVWLYDNAGRILMQRRSTSKDVAPGRWDLSVGERLRPGESYEQAAQRGLTEELGVTGIALEPLGGVRRMRLDLPDAGIRDYELQRSFRGCHDGPLAPDAEEVAEVRHFTVEELRRSAADEPDAFTFWARQDAAELALL